MFEVFGYADRVDSPRIPFEILRCLSWAAESLLTEKCKAVVRLDTAYNYTIVSCRRKFKDLGWEEYWNKSLVERGEAAESSSTVLVLGFPSPDVGNTLLHALAAHELGHQILLNSPGELDKLHERLLLDARRRYSDELKEYIADNSRVREGTNRSDAYEESGKQLEAKLWSISHDWLGEVWSDLVAARLVGPASLAAFDRILLDPAEPTESHPAGVLRRRLVEMYLRQHFKEVAEDETWAPLFVSEPALAHRAERALRADPLRILYMVSADVCGAAVGALAELLDPIATPLTDPDLSKIVARIEENMDNLAPPNSALSRTQINGMSFWLLMYAAWHFRLSKKRFAEFCKRNDWLADPARGEQALGNILLHGLQSAELIYQWHLKNPDLQSQVGSNNGS